MTNTNIICSIDEETSNDEFKLIIPPQPLNIHQLILTYINNVKTGCYYVYSKIISSYNFITYSIDSKLREYYVNQNYDILDCYICMKNKRDKVLISCGHTICNNCYDILVMKSKECPLCRTKVNGCIDFYL